MGKVRGRKIIAPSNIYTAFLALAFCVVLATVAFVIYNCYFQYGVIFKMP
jgi:hypothetical protein